MIPVVITFLGAALKTAMTNALKKAMIDSAACKISWHQHRLQLLIGEFSRTSIERRDKLSTRGFTNENKNSISLVKPRVPNLSRRSILVLANS